MKFSGLENRSQSFILLINVKMPTIVHEQDRFHAQLSMKISFKTSGLELFSNAFATKQANQHL